MDAELIIRGGMVADGLGGEPYEADIAIGQGRILAVGKLGPAARGVAEEDARGLLVTPGFVDVHTHYDAQATWSERLGSSSFHGVTTALIGNCGVGFAPCTPERRDILVALMEGVEDLPEVVLTEGLPWAWQSFPEFLDFLGGRRYDMDIAAQVAHAALRIHVMGQRAADHEQATAADRALMARLAAEAAGRPMTFSLLQREKVPGLWRFLLDRLEEANAAGTPITGQVMGRPIGLMLGFELSQNPFSARPGWRQAAALPFPQRLALLRDPAFRARLLGETNTDPAANYRLNAWHMMFPLNDPPDYEPPPEHSLAAMAARQGRNVEELAYELMLAGDGRGILNRPIINYADGDLAAVKAMVEHPNTLMGLGDGGAHVGLICDASATTSMLTHWTRDRSRGARLPLGFVVRRLTRDNALALGLADRGAIAPGLRADLNLIDYDRLNVRMPELVHDLPAGGKRLLQRADGYVATLLHGQVTYREGEPTAALPGRLIRG